MNNNIKVQNTENAWFDADLMKALFADHKQMEIEKTFIEMIEFLRHKQKEYILNNGLISGIDTAKQMLSEGSITMEMYISMLPAIENYDTPYEVVDVTKKK